MQNIAMRRNILYTNLAFKKVGNTKTELAIYILITKKVNACHIYYNTYLPISTCYSEQNRLFVFMKNTIMNMI